MREFFFFFFRVIKMTLKKKKKTLEKYILKPLFDWKHFLGQIFFFSKTDLIIYLYQHRRSGSIGNKVGSFTL